MSPRKKKDLGELVRRAAAEMAPKAPGDVVIPPLEPHEETLLKLQQIWRRVNESHMEAAEATWAAYQEKLWEHFGFADAAQFFEDRIGVSFRHVQRVLSIWRAHLAIPEAERADARAALTEIGVHKAAIIAPQLAEATEEKPVDWRKLTADAKTHSIQALQDKVSTARGIARKTREPEDDRTLAFLRSRCPDGAEGEFWQELEGVIRDGMVLGGTKSVWAVLIAMAREVKVDWAERADRVRKGQGHAL